ncbi:MAG: hypothetical protein ACAI44_40740 [Candidatus Sericytochromatia bacterium]
MLRRLFLLAGLASFITACAPAGLNPGPVGVRQQAVRPAPRTAAALFPVQQGYHWDYAVTVAPVMDPDDEDHGTYSLEIDKAVPGPAGTRLELRGLSGFSHSYSFPTLIQGPDGIQLRDMTFLGLGADEVQGLGIDFIRLPLQPGQRWEDENWIGKVKGFETVSVPAGNFQAWRIEVIGTYDQAYTTVGDYWIAPGQGVVKAVYTIPDFHIEMLLTRAGLRK